MDLINPAFLNAGRLRFFLRIVQVPTKIANLLMAEGAYNRKGVAALIVIKVDN